MKPIIVILIVLFLTGCGRESTTPFEEYIVEGAETIISFEDDLLAAPVGIIYDNEGNLYIADVGLNQILAFSVKTGEHEIIGRQGQGPGEFNGPVRVQLKTDTLFIVDYMNHRIQIFDTGGNYIRGFPIAADMGVGMPQVLPGDKIGIKTQGNHNSLVAIYDVDGNVVQTYGEPVVEYIRIWDITKIKSEINRGMIPDELRNEVIPVFSDDLNLWILHQTSGRIQKYSADGSLLSDKVIELPEFENVREEFFQRNKDAPPASFFMLSYCSMGQIVNSDLWVLLNTQEADPCVIVVISDTGELRRKLIFPDVRGAQRFAYDATHNKIYFTLHHIAGVKAVAMGEF